MSIDLSTLLTLARQGFIVLNQDIDGDLVHQTHDLLLTARAAGVDELTVDIKSNGGLVRAGLDIYDMIRNFPARKKIGVVNCYARSMGAVILQACDERRCYRHSRILIHYVSTSNFPLDVMKDKRKLDRAIKEGENDQQMLDKILAERTGKSVKVIRQTCAKDTDMSAEEALAFGLIDKVV